MYFNKIFEKKHYSPAPKDKMEELLVTVPEYLPHNLIKN